MAKHGGWINSDDLANLPPPREQPPLHGTYRGTDLYTLPPPAGGWVVLQILNLLERHSPTELAADSPGAMPLSSMSATIAARDARPCSPPAARRAHESFPRCRRSCSAGSTVPGFATP